MFDMVTFSSKIAMWSAVVAASIMTQVILGTVRNISMIKGNRVLTVIIGFFEGIVAITVAITVVTNAVKQGINIFIIASYGAGFALGLFIGMLISNKISRDILSVNIISTKYSDEIEKVLRENGFGLTCYTGSGKDGEIKMLNAICKKSDLPKLHDLAQSIDSDVIVSSHTLERVRGGFF
ncbi:MAG TPA: DUF5698 domain-containing protein [Candidatus Humimicrobiaceae bacterium]